MPYKLEGNTVVKKNPDGSTTPVKGGVHKNHQEALAHLRALYANVDKSMVKMFLVLRGGKRIHKDGTTGDGSGGARIGAGRKKKLTTIVEEPLAKKQIVQPAAVEENAYMKSASKTVLDLEAKHALDDVESMFAVDSNGTLVMHALGNKENVSFPDDADMSKLAGTIMTHNHPYTNNSEDISYMGLSMRDVASSALTGVSEIRAVDKYGAYVFVYRFKSNIAGSEPDRAQEVLNEYMAKNRSAFKTSLDTFPSEHETFNDAKIRQRYMDTVAPYHQRSIKYLAEGLGDEYHIYQTRTGREISIEDVPTW